MATAYILLNVKVNQEGEVFKKIKEMLSAVPASVEYELTEVYGVYDIVLKLVYENMEGLRELLSKIRRIEKIQSTITMLVIEEQEV